MRGKGTTKNFRSLTNGNLADASFGGGPMMPSGTVGGCPRGTVGRMTVGETMGSRPMPGSSVRSHNGARVRAPRAARAEVLERVRARLFHQRAVVGMAGRGEGSPRGFSQA